MEMFRVRGCHRMRVEYCPDTVQGQAAMTRYVDKAAGNAVALWKNSVSKLLVFYT